MDLDSERDPLPHLFRRKTKFASPSVVRLSSSHFSSSHFGWDVRSPREALNPQWKGIWNEMSSPFLTGACWLYNDMPCCRFQHHHFQLALQSFTSLRWYRSPTSTSHPVTVTVSLFTLESTACLLSWTWDAFYTCLILTLQQAVVFSW